MDSKCIDWHKYISKNGYGRKYLNGKMINAHRALWIETNGPIPDGLKEGANMGKYTEGPWSLGSKNYQSVPSVNIKGVDGYHIAKVSSRDEYEANACLIACAPDLLQKLRYAESVLMSLSEHEKQNLEETLDEKIDFMGIACAIAKAEGR